MIRKTYSFISGMCLMLAWNAVAQQMPNASQQVDSAQQRRQLESSANLSAGTNAAPELYQGETSDIGPQSVLKMKHRRTYIEVSADEQYFLTDNMFLAKQGKQHSDVLISTIQAAFAPEAYDFAGGRLSPRIGYQHMWFNYGLLNSGMASVYDFKTATTKTVKLSALDFNVSTVFADAAWRKDNWTFTAGFDFRQLLSSQNYDSFYREYVGRWSARRSFAVDNTLAFSIGYQGDYRLTSTDLPPFASDFNDRTDQSLDFVGSLLLCNHAILQPFYRLQFAHYTRINRDDLLSSIGLTLYCPITKQITFRTFLSYDIMNTDGFFVQDYRKFDAGLGVNLIVRF